MARNEFDLNQVAEWDTDPISTKCANYCDDYDPSDPYGITCSDQSTSSVATNTAKGLGGDPYGECEYVCDHWNSKEEK